MGGSILCEDMPTYEIDRMANRLSHDKMGFNRRLRFCPSCGTRRLERCIRTHDPFGKPIQGGEYWCSLCGFSFNIRTSVEWNVALNLFREHRKLRGGVLFKEDHIAPETAVAWKQKFERPIFRPVSTWNLGEKLKAALGL
jgi:hypothetical protein